MVTIPYTEYWCKDNISLIVYSFITWLVPPPNLIVHLRVSLPRDYEMLRQRIMSRYGRDKGEELNAEYIGFVAKKLEKYVRSYAKRNNVEMIEIPARLDVNERVQKIMEYIQEVTK